MNGRGLLAIAIILMCVGFGGVIHWVATGQGETQVASPPPSVTTPTEPTKPSLTSAEQTYLTYIEGHANAMSYALGELGRLLQDSQIFDDEWIIEAATYMALIQFGYEEAQAADCPSSMSHIHSKYIQGLSHLNTAMDLIAEGIDYLDVDSLNRATTEMTTGGVLIEEAARLKTEFVLAHK